MIKKDKIKKYDRYVKPVYVSNETKNQETYRGKKKAPKPMELAKTCELCHNIIPNNGVCSFCGHITKNAVLIPLRATMGK